MTVYTLAREFGYTPTEIDALDAHTVRILRSLVDAERAVIKERRARKGK